MRTVPSSVFVLSRVDRQKHIYRTKQTQFWCCHAAGATTIESLPTAPPPALMLKVQAAPASGKYCATVGWSWPRATKPARRSTCSSHMNDKIHRVDPKFASWPYRSLTEKPYTRALELTQILGRPCGFSVWMNRGVSEHRIT